MLVQKKGINNNKKRLIHWNTLKFQDEPSLRTGQKSALQPSSETQGQSVGSGERARRKFSSTSERAPGYWLSSNHFQKFKLLIGHKKSFVLLCPIGEQFLLSSFREFVHDGYCFNHGLWGSCTKHPLEFLEIVRWESVPRGSFARTWKLSSRLFSRPDWLPLGLRGCVTTYCFDVMLISLIFSN